MKVSKLTVVVLATLMLVGCRTKTGQNAQTEQSDNEEKPHSDLFEYSVPVDLTQIISVHNEYMNAKDDDEKNEYEAKIDTELPNHDFFLFEDTSFVLRVPEYAGSKQPFLAVAEDFYNSCSLAWNIWSNYEVWLRGHTERLLVRDSRVKKSIKDFSVDVIRDLDIRKAAQNYKDSLLLLMDMDPETWEDDSNPMGVMMSYMDAIVAKSYKFYDDEEVFVQLLDSVSDIAEELAVDSFQHYRYEHKDYQVQVILEELSKCKSFDEQCSLWRNWANCKKSVGEETWIIAVGSALMKSGKYSPILNRVWMTWRALCQSVKFGGSRDSCIPNNYYNEYRKICYCTCLERIERCPDDIFAMNCAAAIAGRTNMNRFGQNYFGNEAMIEGAMMLPNRYEPDDKYFEDRGPTF